MALFFNDFPRIRYDLGKDGKRVLVTNIFARLKPIAEAMSRAAIFYQYTIKDGERADVVSHKIYGSVDYAWIIWMFNFKFDPHFDWPLFYEEFNSYIEAKYGSVQAATQEVKQYEWIVTPRERRNDGTFIEEKKLVVDYATYLTLTDEERRIVYAYDYEFDKNEARREIRVIDGTYIPQILSEKERLLRL